MRFLGVLFGLAVVGAGLFWWLTQPKRVEPNELIALVGDAGRGAVVFHAGGCASCHSAPEAEGEARLELGGGRRFASPFGTFVAPNISPHELGIGGWTTEEFVTAMRHGTSPDGEHYYPAFPYVSYAKASVADLVDLKAFMDALPPVEVANAPHEVPFPFNIRAALGGWKLLFGSRDWALDAQGDAQLERGRYLVEGLGHCAECHTERNMLGGTIADRWLAGAASPDGKGRVPNITPHDSGLGAWSAEEIVEYLTSGFTPDFDVSSGEMYEVVLNMSQLDLADREAIAAYLKAIPALEK